MKRGFIFIIVLLCLLLNAAGCGNKKEDILGTWYFEPLANSEFFSEEGAFGLGNMTFWEDGSFTQDDDYGEVRVTGTYSLSEDSVGIHIQKVNGIRATVEFVCEYQLKGKKLLLTNEGETLECYRQ